MRRETIHAYLLLLPALALLAAGLIVIIGGLMALQNFGRRWITQVLTDNQIVAQTIATEFEARFNDRLTVMRQEASDPQWRDLIDEPQDSQTNEQLIEKLMHLYDTHGDLRVRRWTLRNYRKHRKQVLISLVPR